MWPQWRGNHVRMEKTADLIICTLHAVLLGLANQGISLVEHARYTADEKAQKVRHPVRMYTASHFCYSFHSPHFMHTVLNISVQ
jgi:hypothetical protein